MDKDMLRFIHEARRNGNNFFTDAEREKYLRWLDNLIEHVPRMSEDEIGIIQSYVERSITFYTEICAREVLPRQNYEGCMENLLFLLHYLLYHYPYRVHKESIEKIYRLILSLHDLYGPIEQNRIDHYYHDVKLIETIKFLLYYYYEDLT